MPPEIEQSMASKQQHHHQHQQQQPKNTSKVALETAKRTIVPIVPSKMVIHPISKLDSILGNFYLHTVLFFDRSSEQRKQTFDEEEEELNYALAKALDLFPVVSGRLRVVPANGCLGIKSNDAGVRLTKASSECTLCEWLDETDGFLRRDVFPEVRITDYSVSPLLTIQYTKFRCGSLAVGLSWCHLLADFKSMNVFFNIWGHALRNSGKVPFTPSLHVEKPEAENNVPPELLTAEEGLDINMKFAPELDSYVFHFASATVEKLTHESGCSEVDGLCAFLWKSVVKAQQQGAGSSRLCLWLNSSGESSTYFGNAATTFKLVDSTPVGLVSQSIKEVAKCIQLGGGRVNGSSHTASSLFSRNVLFCNWAADVAFYKTDFGFSSRPLYVECCTSPLLGEGTVTVFPASDGGRGKSVCVSLRRDAMKRLLEDSEFVNATTSRQWKPSTTASAPAA